MGQIRFHEVYNLYEKKVIKCCTYFDSEQKKIDSTSEMITCFVTTTFNLILNNFLPPIRDYFRPIFPSKHYG